MMRSKGQLVCPDWALCSTCRVDGLIVGLVSLVVASVYVLVEGTIFAGCANIGVTTLLPHGSRCSIWNVQLMVDYDKDVSHRLFNTWCMIGISHFLAFHAGAIPEWLGELEVLEELNLSFNAFEGEQYVGSSLSVLDLYSPRRNSPCPEPKLGP